MKTIFFSVAASFFALVSLGHNRIATLDDRKLYGDYIRPGDLIIDTPTRVTSERRDVIYYFMPRQWPGLREGATIWLDGAMLGELNVIKFCNSAQALKPWHIESATFRNIPHTRVVASSFVCQGLKHFELNGESSPFPGLSSWPKNRKFLTGSFGFHVISNLTGSHGYNINVRDGGSIRLNGFEAQHGFSGVRINGGKEDVVVESIEISNFYIHDTGNGEGQYLGSTQKRPRARLKNLIVHNGIITRTAAEALQLQHMIGGADVHNITIYAADVRWINEFMAGQDTGIQWSVDGGENTLHHVVVDGFASIGLMPFGSEEERMDGESNVHHVLFHDGRDTGMYLHKSTSAGIHWIFDNIYFIGFQAPYYQETGRKERDFYVSRKAGSDRMTFSNIYHDGGKPKVFQDTTGIKVGKIEQKKLPAPSYVNSGFHEPANRIMQWHPFYAPYFPVSKRDTVKIQVPTRWNVGDTAIETLGSYGFYKCIKAHLAEKRRPKDNPFFVALTWDSSGVRSDQPSWDARAPQSVLPPDDFRLQKNDHWKKAGFGFQEEILSTTAIGKRAGASSN